MCINVVYNNCFIKFEQCYGTKGKFLKNKTVQLLRITKCYCMQYIGYVLDLYDHQHIIIYFLPYLS